LITPYPYLGEDRTATLRLGGEKNEDQDDVLAKILLDDSERNQKVPSQTFLVLSNAQSLPFTYTAEGKVDKGHAEVAAPGHLADKKLSDPVHGSLGFYSDAVLTIDLGKVQTVKQIVLLTFQRGPGDKSFATEKVSAAVSDNGTDWKPLEQTFVKEGVEGGATEGSLESFILTFDNEIKSQYIKLSVTKTKEDDRQLLSEIIVLSKELPKVVEPSVTEQELPKYPRPLHPSPSGALVFPEQELPKYPRPLHVKYTLDSSLLESKVPFLFNTFVTGIVQDSKRNTVGAAITNRSGHQVILAKRILDVRPKVNSLDTAEFTVVGTPPKENIDLKPFPLLKEVKAEIVSQPFIASSTRNSDNDRIKAGLTNVFPVVNYTFSLNVPAGAKPRDVALRNEIETQIRLATFSMGQSFTADEVFYKHDFKPLSFWREQGKTLAEKSKSITIPDVSELTVSKLPSTGFHNVGAAVYPLGVPTYEKKREMLAGEVKGILGGLRGDAMGFSGNDRFVSAPERQLPILAEYDVVVVGGGTSGAPAGIAAGRSGAKTLVLEHLHDLGGIGTAGAIAGYWYGNVTGFTKEVQDGLRRWSIESKMFWWREKLAEANTDVWYGVLADGALVENNRVKGVLVATPFGPGIVSAKVVIDATGNADIAVAAGSDIQFYDNLEIAVQGAGLSPRNLGASYTNTDFMFADDSDIVDTSHAFVYAKEKYPRAFDQGKLLATRERRQIDGEFSFNVLDQINHRTYPDSIVYAYSDYDTHGYTIDPYMELNHPYRIGTRADGTRGRVDLIYAYVPYRSSIPKELDGILVIGLALSAHRDAVPIVRMQPDLQNQGYAIGRAAAMLAKEPQKNVRELNVRELQKHLVEVGNLAENVLTHEDNFGKTKDRVPQSVETLPDNFVESVPLVMWYPDISKPLIHKAYLAEKDFEKKLMYAKIAATLGDPVGVLTIIEKIQQFPQWDEGWKFKAMGQAGAATSPLDQLIMMLGITKDARSVDCIIEKMKQLEPDAPFSHFRAVAKALENIGGEKAAKALYELLQKPGMTGYYHHSIEDAKKFDADAGQSNTNQEKARRDSLVEISLARALYRCGDVDGFGENILRNYAKDLRGFYARHAKEVLKK
ncbi:MAG: FAD-dependent oxidoreductase, partial [Planctomycetaceae bacterium]|nr:FAD-dependent oxidoreductase [Planctomycetaceae bacterium]